MSDYPEDLKYTAEHEWVRSGNGSTVRVGITEYAADQLGDIVFVELPETEAMVAEGDEVVVIESVKAASDVYAPLPGKVVEANARLSEDPSLVNRDPTGEGWFYKLEIADAAALDELMDEAGYQRFVESQA